MLKQELHAPVPLEEQVMIIYVATNGFLDDLPVDEVKPFERAFLPFLRDRFADLGLTIAKARDFTADQQETLKKAVNEFKSQWKK